MGIDTIATLIAMAVGIVSLGAVVLASNQRTRTELRGEIAELRAELKGDIAELRAELKGDIARLDERVYALAAGLAPRLASSTTDRPDNT